MSSIANSISSRLKLILVYECILSSPDKLPGVGYC